MKAPQPLFPNHEATKTQRVVLWCLFALATVGLVVELVALVHPITIEGALRIVGGSTASTLTLLAGNLYLCWLFFRTARTGKAPVGWLIKE